MWRAECIKDTLNLGHDDTLQWDWALSSKAKWTVLDPSHKKKYYDKWRNEPFPTPDEFPHQVDLGSGEAGPLLPFHRTATVSGTIIVRKSYSDLYNRILTYRRDSGGVIITGQPGVGKTMFLKYMLARLLSEKQVVVFYTTSGIHLFYQGAVYYHSETPDAIEAINNLPYHTQSTFSPWMLVDMDLEVREPRIYDVPSVWPILASSPNRKRWQCWAKQLDGVMGYERMDQGGFDVRTAWPPKQEQTQVNASPPVHRAVNFLESAKIAIAAQAATGDKEDYLMADATLSTVDPVDDALETLVDHAIGEVYAARTVYKAIFDSKDTTNFSLPDHSFKALCGIVRSFGTERSLPNDADRVIIVRPRNAQGPDNDDWQVDFVSDRQA